MHVAEFLEAKVANMRKWLESNGFTSSAVEIPRVALVVMAQTLKDEFAVVIQERNFAKLHHPELPPEMVGVVEFVKSRPELQDRFWRYLALFSEVV